MHAEVECESSISCGVCSNQLSGIEAKWINKDKVAAWAHVECCNLEGFADGLREDNAMSLM